MKKILILTLGLFLCSGEALSSSGNLSQLLDKRGSDLIGKARAGKSESRAVFSSFVRLVADELSKAGDVATAKRLTAALENPAAGSFPRAEFAWLVHTFAREFYKEEIIRETTRLITFKTFATDVPNRLNPEFIRQKEYLRSLAGKLGLQFNDVGGYVQEIWIGEGEKSFGLMSHSDVQPVNPEGWTHDPWGGEIIDGKIWGRGSVDDKGPIVAIMYGMRAILDSGIPLKRKIVLLVGTDEESANEDVATYLKTHKAPDQTIVVDSNYPVICAEKGWNGIWLHVPKAAGTTSGDGYLITRLQSGFSPSIVPDKATATLVLKKGNSSRAKAEIETAIRRFQERRPRANIGVEQTGDSFIVTARGTSVHAADPSRGHNALMDLLVFLHEEVGVVPNAFGLMAKFAAQYIGLELDGRNLGIAHQDDFMGQVTVAGNIFQETDTTVMFMFNFRVPRGVDRATINRELNSRIDRFGKEHGFRFSERRIINTAHYLDPEGPFVRKLLGIYNRLTGEEREAQSIGGGTYAHRIPNAVVFGPALPHEEYRGHRPDEYLLISTLVKNIEILTHTMVDFATEP